MNTAGTRSSEFRLVVLAIVIGMLLIATGLLTGDDAILYSGVGVLMSAVPGYALSRGMAKRGE